MPDDLLQQASQNAPAIGAGGISGGVVAFLAALKMFASPKDIELAKSDIRAEVAEKLEKFARKDELISLSVDIAYIRQRIDQIVDNK